MLKAASKVHTFSDTVLGKMVGSFTAVCGVLVMALPIPIVVDNFGDYYAEQKRLEQAELKKEAQEREAKMVRRQEITLQVSHVTHDTMRG